MRRKKLICSLAVATIVGATYCAQNSKVVSNILTLADFNAKAQAQEYIMLPGDDHWDWNHPGYSGKPGAVKCSPVTIVHHVKRTTTNNGNGSIGASANTGIGSVNGNIGGSISVTEEDEYTYTTTVTNDESIYCYGYWGDCRSRKCGEKYGYNYNF